MSGVDVNTVMGNWKNSLSGNQPSTDNTTSNEVSEYKVGQVLTAIRSVDGQKYTLGVKIVGTNYVVADIDGPGQYNGKPLKKPNGMELYPNGPGKLKGNSDLGEFTIIK